MNENNTSEQPVVTVSESAADMIKTAARNANAEDAVVRFSIQQTDSTIAHRIDLERMAADDDIVFEQYGLTMVVEKAQVPLLAGSHFDYAEEGSTGKLLVSNPNLPQG
jgi:iron-sulfur cluster assembly accessory protein